MRDKFLSIFLFLLIMSCSEEELPAGIYDYQVERLLSGTSGSKTWDQVVNSSNCSDSVRLHVVSVDDSLDFSRLTYQTVCSIFDTTYLGRANASKAEDRDLFTDSLRFQNGDFWIVKTITSDLLTIEIEQNVTRYRARI